MNGVQSIKLPENLRGNIGDDDRVAVRSVQSVMVVLQDYHRRVIVKGCPFAADAIPRIGAAARDPSPIDEYCIWHRPR